MPAALRASSFRMASDTDQSFFPLLQNLYDLLGNLAHPPDELTAVSTVPRAMPINTNVTAQVTMSRAPRPPLLP